MNNNNIVNNNNHSSGNHHHGTANDATLACAVDNGGGAAMSSEEEATVAAATRQQMKNLFQQQNEICISLDHYTIHAISMAEELERIFKEERADAITTTQKQQQQSETQEFIAVVGEECRNLLIYAKDTRHTYEVWYQQLKETKYCFALYCNDWDPKLFPEDDNRRNGYVGCDHIAYSDDDTREDFQSEAMQRKTRVKKLLAKANKIDASLNQWTKSVNVSVQLLGLVRQILQETEERPDAVTQQQQQQQSQSYRDACRKLYTCAVQTRDMHKIWYRQLKLAKLCFALRCNERDCQNVRTGQFRHCGKYIGEAIRRNTMVSCIHLELGSLLGRSEDIQTVNSLVEFVRTSATLSKVIIDGDEDSRLGQVYELTCLFFTAGTENIYIENLSYHGLVPATELYNLLSTKNNLKIFEFECYDQENVAPNVEALVHRAFASNCTIEHLMLESGLYSTWGLARKILLQLHKSLPKLRRLGLRGNVNGYAPLQHYLRSTISIEQLDLLEFLFYYDNVDCLINGLRHHYFETSKPTISKLTLKDCNFDAEAADKFLQFMQTRVEFNEGKFRECASDNQEKDSPCQIMLLPRLMYAANVIAPRRLKYLLGRLMSAEEFIGPQRCQGPPRKRKL